MIEVYLTSGPRGSGKSEYVRRFIAEHPEVTLISRDAVLIELMGATSISPYSGGHQYAMQVLFERVKAVFAQEGGVTLILDCWNGFPNDRKYLIQELERLGADHVH